MRFDQLPRSDRVEDHRGRGSRAGRSAGLGIGTILILGLIGWALGINPLYLIGGAEMLSRMGGGSQEQSQPQTRQADAPPDPAKDFVSAVLGSSEVQWKEIFARNGRVYQAPA